MTTVDEWPPNGPDPDGKETGTKPKVPSEADLARVIRSAEDKWWSPYPKTGQQRDPTNPDPSGYFTSKEWTEEIRKVYNTTMVDRVTEFDEQKEVFIAIYDQDALPKIKAKQDLGDLMKELEVKYAKICLWYEMIDEGERDPRERREVSDAAKCQ